MEISGRVDWWLHRFGRFGRVVQKLAQDSVLDAHEEHAQAQDQISAPHRRVYGSVNSSAQYMFVQGLREYPDVYFQPPKSGAPQLPVVNGRVVVLWRYANRDGIDVLSRKFATSSSRTSTFDMPVVPKQATFDFEVDEDLRLTDEDKQLLECLESAASSEMAPGSRLPVVVLAYASNAAGIYRAVGADAQLRADGTLALQDVHDFRPTAQEPTKGMADGHKRFDRIPRKPFVLEAKTGNEE